MLGTYVIYNRNIILILFQTKENYCVHSNIQAIFEHLYKYLNTVYRDGPLNKSANSN